MNKVNVGLSRQQRSSPQLRANVVSARPGGVSLAQVRQMAKSDPQGFIHRMQGLIDAGKFSWRSVGSMKELLHAFADVPVRAQVNVMGKMRSVTTSAFPLLAGALTVAAFNEAYDRIETVGQELVSDVNDNRKVSFFARIADNDKAQRDVEEGEPFPLVGATSDWVTVGHKRNGRRLAITAETMEETDNPAMLLDQIDGLAELATDYVEEQTLSRISDVFGSASSAAAPYVYNPKGVGASLFSVTANTPGTRAPSGTRLINNALEDHTDLDQLRNLLATMKNDRGRRIGLPLSELILLVPDALAGKASTLLGSEKIPGEENALNPWGPLGRYAGVKLLSTPKLDDYSTSAYYMGRPKRQFKRKWKLAMEYVSLTADPVAFLTSRIYFQARIAWDVEIGAVDYVYWVQSLAGSVAATAPSDPFAS